MELSRHESGCVRPAVSGDFAICLLENGRLHLCPATAPPPFGMSVESYRGGTEILPEFVLMPDGWLCCGGTYPGSGVALPTIPIPAMTADAFAEAA